MGTLKMLPKLAEIGSFFPKTVSGGPVKEVVRRDGFSLSDYPILHCWPQDAGRFITLPLVFSKNPDTGKRNCGMYRMQVFDERTTGMHWQTHKQGAEHYRRMAAQGGAKRMDVAVAIGGDPATIFSAVLPLPPDIDEMLFAGFLRGAPVEMVKCETATWKFRRRRRLSSKATSSWASCGARARSAITPATIRSKTITRSSTSPASPAQGAGLRGDDRRPAAHGGLFHGQSDRADFSAADAAATAEIRDISMPAEGIFHNLMLVAMRKSYPGTRAR